MLAGKTPDSPKPNADRATRKLVKELPRACPIEARLQKTMDSAYPSRVPSRSIDPADHHHADRIGPLEGKHQIAEVDVVPSQIVLQWAFEDSQDLAVHIVFCGSEEQESTDDPTEVAGSVKMAPDFTASESAADARFAELAARSMIGIVAFIFYVRLPIRKIPDRIRAAR